MRSETIGLIIIILVFCTVGVFIMYDIPIGIGFEKDIVQRPIKLTAEKVAMLSIFGVVGFSVFVYEMIKGNRK